MTKNKKEVILNDNSKGYIPDYYSTKSFGYLGIFGDGRTSEFDVKKALNVVKNDPVVKAAITTLVDKVLESVWRIFKQGKNVPLKNLEFKFKKLRLSKVLRKALFNLFLYNNAFIELVKKRGGLSDINVLETTLMEIVSEDNGDITGYFQNVGGDINPSWKPDEIVHIKFRDITNNVWAAPLDLQALYETVLVKDYIRQWLAWFFGTNQMRGLYTIESGTSEAKIKDFLSYLKASEKDRTKPIVLQGKVVYTLLNKFSDEGQSILDVLKWCDEQILMLMQVPPISVGQPDSSGRSNSVEQNNALSTTVNNVKKILEEAITFDLFPKANIDDAEFKFEVIDEVNRRGIFEVAEIMKNMMFTDEAIVEFLNAKGIFFETKKIFKDPEELAGLSNKDVKQGSEGMIGNKPQGVAKSRRGQDKKSISDANKVEQIKNSVDKFKGYPYEYEVVKE